jgi:hypothetical protein
MKTKNASKLATGAMFAFAAGTLFSTACMGGGDGSTNPAGSSAAASASGSTAAGTGASVQIAAKGSSSTGTIVPLYTPPTDPSWAAVEAAKKAHPSVPVVVVINPADGPGAAVDPAYTSGIAQLVGAGVKVVGYVHTLYAARPAADAETDMETWRSFYPGVTGIFLDEQANVAGHEDYYKQLDSYAKSRGFDFTIGNPGADTAPTYVGTVDVMLIYESPGLPALSFLAGWHARFDRHNFGIIPYGVPAIDPAYVQAARAQVGYIYVQSDNMPNPWDTVPADFDSLLAQLQ